MRIGKHQKLADLKEIFLSLADQKLCLVYFHHVEIIHHRISHRLKKMAGNVALGEADCLAQFLALPSSSYATLGKLLNLLLLDFLI